MDAAPFFPDDAVVYSLPCIVKALPPAAAGGRRRVVVEASTEAVDLEGDLITQEALLGAADGFLARGHIDIDHYSEFGPRIGIADPRAWIIGRPLEVKAANRSTNVLCDVAGAPESMWDPVQRRNVALWKDLTAEPPVPWYASVYGFPLPGGLRDCRTGTCSGGVSRFLITKFDWRSLALTRRPVNDALSAARVVFAKSLIADFLSKADPGSRERPIVVRSPADMAAAAARTTNPTEAQAAAGNYRKGHVDVCGLDVSIETPMGGVRQGVDGSGTPWSVRMPVDYGYVKRTIGADGDHVDAYFGPDCHIASTLPVWIVDQVDPETRLFDEHKVMVGFPNRETAMAAYRAAFSDGSGPRRAGAVTGMSFDAFAYGWLKDGDTRSPVAKDILKPAPDGSTASVIDPGVPPVPGLFGLKNMDDVWDARTCAKCGVHGAPSLVGYRSHFAKCAGMAAGHADIAAHAVMHRANVEKFLRAI